MKSLPWIVGSIVVLGGLGAGVAAYYANNRRRALDLPTLLIGDSLAVGLASPLRMLGIQLHSIAVGGTNVAYWASGKGAGALHTALAAGPRPSVVIVSLGTNDAYLGDAYASTANASAIKLIKTLEDAGVTVYWLSPPSLPDTYGAGRLSKTVLEQIQKAVESTPAIWLDQSTATIERSGDKLHPTAAGYLHWADLILDGITQAFVSPAAETASTAAAAAPAATVSAVQGDTRPPPPVVVHPPENWHYVKQADFDALPAAVSRGVRTFAGVVLLQRRPFGDLQLTEIEGHTFGAFTEPHYDDHVNHKLMWHPGVSILMPGKGPS